MNLRRLFKCDGPELKQSCWNVETSNAVEVNVNRSTQKRKIYYQYLQRVSMMFVCVSLQNAMMSKNKSS